MKIDFEVQTQYGTFRDALYLQDDHTLTEAEIEVMKQQRADNWVAYITTPPVESIFTDAVPPEAATADLPAQE